MRLCLSLFNYVWVPVSPKSPATLFVWVDYQAAGFGSNQMGKKSEYTFVKPSGAENHKEWAREMIFALKGSGLWGYVDGTITKPAPLSANEETTVEVKQETQDKIDRPLGQERCACLRDDGVTRQYSWGLMRPGYHRKPGLS